MTDSNLRTGPSAGDDCRLCDEPIVIYNPGGQSYDKEIGPVVGDAVDHANRHPSNNALEGNIRAGFEEGYYPGEYQHFIDLSTVDEELRHSATISINSELNKRGLMFNSVHFGDEPKLHVVPATHLLDRLPGMQGVER